MLIAMLTPEVWSQLKTEGRLIFRKIPATPIVPANIFSGRECRGGTGLDQKNTCRKVRSLLKSDSKSKSVFVVLIFVLISFHLKIDKEWVRNN